MRLITFSKSSSADSDANDPEPEEKISEVNTDSNEAVAGVVDAADVAPSDSTQVVETSVDDGSNELQAVVPILAVAPSQEISTEAIDSPVGAVAPSQEGVASSGDDTR